MGITLFLPELIWYAYGSTFIYDDSIDLCKNNEDGYVKALYLTALVGVFCTYFYFLGFTVICFVFCAAYKTWYDYKKCDEEQQ